MSYVPNALRVTVKVVGSLNEPGETDVPCSDDPVQPIATSSISISVIIVDIHTFVLSLMYSCYSKMYPQHEKVIHIELILFFNDLA